jgi:hypothetical protein
MSYNPRPWVSSVPGGARSWAHGGERRELWPGAGKKVELGARRLEEDRARVENIKESAWLRDKAADLSDEKIREDRERRADKISGIIFFF